jgi:class 3 adenylate cyclase
MGSLVHSGGHRAVDQEPDALVRRFLPVLTRFASRPSRHAPNSWTGDLRDGRVGLVTIFASQTILVEHLRQTGTVIWTSEQEKSLDELLMNEEGQPAFRLNFADPARGTDLRVCDGMAPRHSDIFIVPDLYSELISKRLDGGESHFWRHTLRSYERSFVFVDVSDFSKFDSPMQLLVVQSLIRMATRSEQTMGLHQVGPEAKLCIGDGYVFVFRDPYVATGFAARFAAGTESAIALEKIPEFHFRIGVHAGPVRFFWDPGRNDYNYIGDGINDASRVLSAIGKDVDDVVFVSGAVRQHIHAASDPIANRFLDAMENKGRKADKHGKFHRVYQLNHLASLRLE